MTMPPTIAAARDNTEPTPSHGRHALGGASCAQPNQTIPKTPRIAAVAAALAANGRRDGRGTRRLDTAGLVARYREV
ncbi:hypothetical protein ACFFKH_15770 [Micromonospora marina]|uniref:hypothetical protein n=1 Tax=Micromonospora marina TaxID=307120 RepID=UPI00142894A7|nr:hypothetical protein [Micromonospora marina]